MPKTIKQEIYSQEISIDTFEGNWPFKVPHGTLINNSNAIVFRSPRGKHYTINGLAVDRFKRLRKLKRIHRRDDSNGFFVSVSDIITYGLKMNPNYIE